MKSQHTLLRATLLTLLAATPAAAQTVATAQTGMAGNEWSHGSTLNLLVGANTGDGQTGAIAGAGLGWEITPWFGIEGSGAWLTRGDDEDAFAADIKAMAGYANLSGIVPFVSAGFGMYLVPRPTAVTEPSFVVGGGVNFHVSRHVAIRPEIEARIVPADAGTFTVTAFVVRLAYHFEDHPITPTHTRP